MIAGFDDNEKVHGIGIEARPFERRRSGVGVIEAPIAAAVGRRLFKERLTLRQTLGGTLTAGGVVMTALGQLI